MLSKRYFGGYSVGDHLFPFRTEKLSPTAPMVLHTRGRVGRRQLFYKPLSTDLLREAFFCVIFLEARPYLKMMRPHLGASCPHLGATRPRVGICLARLDALTSKYNTFSHCQVGGSNPNLAMPTRGRVALQKTNAQKKSLSQQIC